MSTPKDRSSAPCYLPCAQCGQRILLVDVWKAKGNAMVVETLAVDPNWPTAVVHWKSGAVRPEGVRSGAYPLHRCCAKQEETT